MIPQPTQQRRPVGVWIATFWAGLFAGLFPLGLVLIFYFGPARGAEMISGIQLALSLGLGVGIIASAVGAWRGVSQARYTLVALVVLHYGLLAYQHYQMAAAGLRFAGALRSLGHE